MRTGIVLFTRDLRVHDQPALAAAAAAAERVVPLFVLDEAILGSSFAAPNRVGFLLESLADLRGSLRRIGAPLVVRQGNVGTEVARIAGATGAEAVFLSEDVSAYARRREDRLRRARLDVRTFPGITVVPAGELKPYRVFTPYHRRWVEEPRREEAKTLRLRAVSKLALGTIPKPPAGRSPVAAKGGETAGLRRLERWLGDGYRRYEAEHDVPAADATSRLSPYLHFGCVSPLALANRIETEPLRQLAWRDFFAQLLLHHPGSGHDDFRDRGDRWNDDAEGLQAWKDGRTGYPLVDAGMRQLAREGWMHNRARMVAGSFLTKHLYVDWRLGAAHFYDLLLDGDLASNAGNWQWVAGTGADTRPNRVLNPTLQARRHDPDGAYVRRYVPEYGTPDYPPPLVDHHEATARFRALRRRR